MIVNPKLVTSRNSVKPGKIAIGQNKSQILKTQRSIADVKQATTTRNVMIHGKEGSTSIKKLKIKTSQPD